jgi:hypothetical protein
MAIFLSKPLLSSSRWPTLNSHPIQELFDWIISRVVVDEAPFFSSEEVAVVV